MSITTELREYASSLAMKAGASTTEVKGALEEIADHIDQEHDGEVFGLLREHDEWVHDRDANYIQLPKDADGVPFHIGELVDEMLPFGGYAAPAPIDTMELSRGASGYGWMVKLDAENRASISPSLLRHHHEPTVEDVLRKFAEGLGVPVADSYVAATAAKLRLAGEDA